MSSRKNSRRASRSIDIPIPAAASNAAVLNSPDEERAQAFEEYAISGGSYSDDHEYSHLDSDHVMFVPSAGTRDLEESHNQAKYRHVAVHSAFSTASTSPFVRTTIMVTQCAYLSTLDVQASYSSSPSTSSSFYKSAAYSASPPMMSIFGKQPLPDFKVQVSPFASAVAPLSPSLSLENASTTTFPSSPTLASSSADPFHQELPVPALETTEFYHKVNPSFPTKSTPMECLEFFAKTLSTLGFQYSIKEHWTIAVTGLLCVEEVQFSIQLKQDVDNLIVDFTLEQGCERNFLRLFDIVRHLARSLDAQPLPTTSFVPSMEWLDVDSMPELFPGSSHVSATTLLEYCEEYLQLADDATTTSSTRGDASRLEMAACIKNACLSDKNRALVVASAELAGAFGSALYRMAQDDQLSIVRFAVFILSLFDVSTLVALAAHLQVDGGMLSVLDKMETHDPIPKMKSIAASVRTKLVPSN
ncbi:hypothetical protein DYB25_010027 [Aphanomyces astaci]|uniref:KA1 domain-containing protein n=3 Tax=Aphanomyces astaci TaxID=112090 RepID=A0A397B6Q1_APHAT|nr:hypothetical protein DYB25_010027 [Aphanomyces astaci]RHY54855.1 hypothetical protein DYB34_008961 [Aphanomyces astaci]RHY71258.1 hypothetical protein DYB38_008642 [Aphanomyces astaci]RHZ29440.1 hypothetical protein DYB26_006861 [Aphanomyces astaci]RHZ39938.1 hypothetical protein DYB31_008823 [Aphanomyces astaci]